MAVRTPDLALLDLGRDFIPRRRATNERRDVGELVAPMIEIEHSGVVLAAIHAVVSVKVCAYRFDEDRTPSGAVADNATCLWRARSHVPIVRGFTLA